MDQQPANTNANSGAASDNAADILNGKIILWVEDDTLISSILSRKISQYKSNLILVKSGSEAFARLEALKPAIPNVVVLDLMLPEMSGFDILKKLRDNPLYAKVPAIILSNLNQPADIERAKILGANKFMVKAASSLDTVVKEIVKLV